MIKAVLLDYAGVIRQKGDLMEDIVALCPEEFTCVKAKELYDLAKVNTISNEEYEKAFTKEAMDYLYDNITIHVGLMDFLKKNKLPVYVASNYVSSVIEKEIDLLNIRDYFKDVFVSDKLGVAKPNKDFFTKILDKINLLPNEVIFADDQKRNLVPAKKIGMKTVWVNNTKVDNFGNNAEIIPDAEIYDLNKLNNIIGELND